MERTLIVGLGNPGPQYEQTRHNIGFLAVDSMANQQSVMLSQNKFQGIYGQGRLGTGEAITLLKPQTFMNLSGRSVVACAQFFKVPPEKIIIIHDELEFPFGVVKVKVGGGHAGHNGLKSIISLLGTRDFLRIRVGIGRPKRGDVSNYVLAPFSTDEQPWLDDVTSQVARDVCQVIHQGARRAMNEIHARPSLIPKSE